MPVEAKALIAAAIAILLLSIATGAREVQAQDSAAAAARAEFKRDLAAAKVCKGQPFEWQGNTLICHKEAR